VRSNTSDGVAWLPLSRPGSKIETSRATSAVVVRMVLRYRLRDPMSAILDKPDGEHVTVTIPAGALLVRHSQPQEKSTTLFGMVGVFWEERHYSVYPNELAFKAELVEGA
jgi:hypothetical protein